MSMMEALAKLEQEREDNAAALAILRVDVERWKKQAEKAETELAKYKEIAAENMHEHMQLEALRVVMRSRAEEWRQAAQRVHQKDSPSIYVACADELDMMEAAVSPNVPSIAAIEAFFDVLACAMKHLSEPSDESRAQLQTAVLAMWRRAS